jgi:hypothetical protein
MWLVLVMPTGGIVALQQAQDQGPDELQPASQQ